MAKEMCIYRNIMRRKGRWRRACCNLARYGAKPIPTLPPMDVELGEEQMAAVRACMNNTVLILTGRPWQRAKPRAFSAFCACSRAK